MKNTTSFSKFARLAAISLAMGLAVMGCVNDSVGATDDSDDALTTDTKPDIPESLQGSWRTVSDDIDYLTVTAKSITRTYNFEVYPSSFELPGTIDGEDVESGILLLSRNDGRVIAEIAMYPANHGALVYDAAGMSGDPSLISAAEKFRYASFIAFRLDGVPTWTKLYKPGCTDENDDPQTVDEYTTQIDLLPHYITVKMAGPFYEGDDWWEIIHTTSEDDKNFRIPYYGIPRNDYYNYWGEIVEVMDIEFYYLNNFEGRLVNIDHSKLWWDYTNHTWLNDDGTFTFHYLLDGLTLSMQEYGGVYPYSVSGGWCSMGEVLEESEWGEWGELWCGGWFIQAIKGKLMSALPDIDPDGWYLFGAALPDETAEKLN